MSLHATPVLYLNMGGEMLYVLRQRLKAQKISVDKTIQVLDDVTAALLNPQLLSSVFEESPLTGVPFLRSTLECVILSSIMKLDKTSMDKLFDLMIMIVKYQLTAATGPREVILLTLNHTDAMRDMVSNPSAQQCVGLVHQMVIDFYGSLTFEQVWNVRNACLKELEPYCARVSVLLRMELQNEDGSFNLLPQKYNEKYEENEDSLSNKKLRDGDPGSSGGSFNLFGERMTLLGRNIYSPMYGTSTNLQSNNNKSNQTFLTDYGAKAELGMLAVQLGTEETMYKRPFTLNLFSNEDNDNIHVKNEDSDSMKNNSIDNEHTKDEKANCNKDYKMKLDNVCASFIEDQHEEIKHTVDLLQLLDETE